jgi:hypothetical protein
MSTRRGVAAAMTPFNFDLSLDEDGYLRNMRHWVSDLKIDGLSFRASKVNSRPCRLPSGSDH